MSKRDITLFLEDITESIERISDYIENYSKEDFQNDQKLMQL